MRGKEEKNPIKSGVPVQIGLRNTHQIYSKARLIKYSVSKLKVTIKPV